MRRAAKVDDNQADIVRALRRFGCSVQPLHTIGKGCPDLLVGRAGRTTLLEVKDGRKPPSGQKLTEDQIEWIDAWRGSPVTIVSTVDEALHAVLGTT